MTLPTNIAERAFDAAWRGALAVFLCSCMLAAMLWLWAPSPAEPQS